MDLSITEGFTVEALRKVKEGHIRWDIRTFNEEGKLTVKAYQCGNIIRIDIKEDQ